ncbi:sigma-70 family RNA polymerase sigma factor [Jatrophihabitans sp.]|uniref:sigma-70 family RNA polymerase sigma factor n=1 Tax=Jatrophihabitans sp. TaxID=1932789 RepID=UPI0030C748B6|nr:polymerase, sigma-24 subunit, subfamily [Jatrophihabitans sp.]
MSRASVPHPEPTGPGAGWRALAERIAEQLVGALNPALAAGGPLDMGMTIDAGAARQTGERHAPSPRRSTGGRVSPPVPEPEVTEMAEEHTEIWKLVGLAQAGDGEAFGQLYDRYVDTVFRFIYFRVNDRTLAEDFTSETFLRALRRIGTISYQGRDIGAWFVTIARNIVLDHLKSARARLEMTTGEVIEGKEHSPSPELAVIESLTSETLMAAVRRLGDEQRECVMLRFIQGLSVSETAAVMGKNDGAIKALQHRAVRKLAELLGGEAL